MKKLFFRTISVFLTCLLLVLSGCKGNKSKEDLKVKEDFNALQQAFLTNNGESAVEYVTDDTISWYNVCRQYALNSSGVDFEKISVVQVTCTFMIRYLYKKSELENMNGRQFLISCIQKGLVDKDTVKLIVINEIRYDGNIAIVTITKEGEKGSEGYLKFYKKNNKWQLDVVDLIARVNAAEENIAKKANKTKTEYVISTLELIYNKKIPSSILKGPLE
jgi:hypothetical protein